MKINDINRIGGVNPYRKANAHGNGLPVGKKGSARDEVKFSEEAMKLLETQGTTPVDPTRAAKVNELKDAVANGQYKVDADKIANAMLAYFKI